MTPVEGRESNGQDGHSGSERETHRRINLFIDSLLEEDSLSSEAKNILQHLRDSDENLTDMDTEQLGKYLLEGLQ